MEPDRCPECGAPLPDGGTCRENLHALLALEAAIPGGPGPVPWHRGAWPMTVADVLSGAATAPTYAARVRRWARSVCDTLAVQGW